jgi:hypothetical protein
MPPYRIELTASARADLACYRAFDQGVIVSRIKGQLPHEPLQEPRNRKSRAWGRLFSYLELPAS